MLYGLLNRRAPVVLLAAIAALLAAGLLLAYGGVPLAEAQSPPATPSSVTLTAGGRDGYGVLAGRFRGYEVSRHLQHRRRRQLARAGQQ